MGVPLVLDTTNGLTAAVIGTGTMGRGIVRCLGAAGYRVRAYDVSIRSVDEFVRKESASWLEAARTVEAAVRDCSVVIEVVAEDVPVKADVLARISAAAPVQCLVATNTSSIDVNTLAPHVANPGRFIGLHFFNPAELVPGVEVVVGSESSADAVASAVALVERLGKRPSVVSSAPGFVVNRLQMALFLESVRCVEEGLVSMEDLDRVVSSTIGFRLPAFGPFKVADMAGLDVYASILEVLEDAYGQRFATPASLTALVAEGHFGLKTGGGFADHAPDDAAALVARRDNVYRRLAACLHD